MRECATSNFFSFLIVPSDAKKKQTCNQNNSSCSINAQERRNESLPQVRITKDAKAEQAREGGSADRELNPGTRVAFVDRSSLAPVGASASGGHGFCVISPRHAPKCPAGAEFHSDPFSTFRRGQDFTLMRSPLVGDGRISQRCLLRVSTVAKYLPRAFPGTHPWQDFRLMYDKRGLGRKNTPLCGNISPICIQNELALARFTRRVSKKPCKPLFGNTHSENLARKDPLFRPRPINHT